MKHNVFFALVHTPVQSAAKLFRAQFYANKKVSNKIQNEQNTFFYSHFLFSHETEQN